MVAVYTISTSRTEASGHYIKKVVPRKVGAPAFARGGIPNSFNLDRKGYTINQAVPAAPAITIINY